METPIDREPTATLICYDDAVAQEMAAALEAAGVRRSEDGSIWVVVTDTYLNPDLDGWNRRALRDGRTWMILKPCGAEPWIGPIFIPGRTACWSCLSHRLKENGCPEAQPGEAAIAACQSAADRVARWLASGEAGDLEGRIRTADGGLHPVLRRPQCPDCCKPHSPDFVPVNPQHKPAVFTVDGGYRTCPPEATLQTLERLVSPISGIIRDVRPMNAGNSRLHAFTARHTIPLEQCVRGGLPQVEGKGLTAAQARASCLAEAVERHSTIFRGDEPRRLARYVDLKDDAVHPGALLRFSARQYELRDEWNASHTPRHYVPEPFDETARIEWAPAWSLTERRVRYLPAAYCYLRYPLFEGAKFCRADSNGCAAGNTIEEAILQGFFELVERDAVALWWYNRVRRPAVGADDLLTEARRDFAGRDATLDVLDLTSDLEIPAAVAVSIDRDGSVNLGSGAHLDPRLAVSRAVTELNQLRESQGPGPKVAGEFLKPMADKTTWPPAAPSADLAECIDECVRRVARKGIEVIVLDLTRPDLGFPVVRVAAPGLRHFWSRLGPGRLYEVPAALGWLSRPPGEAELNPVPFFM